MNSAQIQQLFDNYIANFDMIRRNETYKWRAIGHVQKAWDLAAPDVSAMLKEAFSQSYNLINNKTVQPASGLVQLAKVEPEAVRDAFAELLFSTDDLTRKQAQVTTFVAVTNSLLEKHFSGKWKFQQEIRTAIAYLSMVKPAENYMFKSTAAHFFANYMGFSDDIGYGQWFRLERYYAMCDELVEFIKASPEMIAIDATRPVPWQDPSYHVMAYDLIYCFHAYGLTYGMKQPIKSKPGTARGQGEDRRQEIASIQSEQDALQNQIEQLQAEIDDLPELNLVGMAMETKAFGQVTIARQDGRFIWYPPCTDRQRFALPDCITNGFLTPDDEALIERCKHETELNRQIVSLKSQLDAKTKELRKYQ